jgi:ribulose-phosphate 3-epimerase
MLISASILSADFTQLGIELALCKQAGVDWVHIDVMDGHFVPNLTMGPLIVAACKKATTLPLDVHLMVDKPERLIDHFAQAGADWLTVHVETCPHLHRTLQQIRDAGCRPGVVINPGTPTYAIFPVLHMVDLVLVMSVNPGYSGQVHLPEVLPKISEIRQELNRVNPSGLIEIDGGITEGTAPAAIKAGADILVAATAIFKHPQGIAGGVAALRNSVTKDERG